MAILVRVGNRIYSISSECSLSYANIHLSFKTVNLHKIMCEDFRLFLSENGVFTGDLAHLKFTEP